MNHDSKTGEGIAAVLAVSLVLFALYNITHVPLATMRAGDIPATPSLLERTAVVYRERAGPEKRLPRAVGVNRTNQMSWYAGSAR